MRIQLILVIVLISFSTVSGKDYYWVGGTGNWSDINHWSAVSGNSPMQLHTVTPTSSDNVILDSLSFPAGGGTVNINLNIAFCKNFVIRDLPSNVNIVFSGNSKVFRIFGDVLISDTLSWLGNGKVTLEGSGTNYISIRGVLFPNLHINSNAAHWKVLDSLEVGDLYVQYGELDLQGQSLQANKIEVLNSSQLTIDSCVVRVAYRFNSTGGCKLETEGSTLIMLDNNSQFYNYPSNSHHFDEIILLDNSRFFTSTLCSSEVLDIRQNIFIGGEFSADSVYLDPSTSMVIDAGSSLTLGYLDAHGNCSSFIEIQSSGLGSIASFTHTSSMDTASFVRLRDISISGQSWRINNYDNVNNSSLGISGSLYGSGQKFFWVNGNGSWDDTNHWSTVEGGPAGTCIPSALDTVVFSDYSSTGLLNVVMPDKDINISSMYVGATFNIAFTGYNRPIILDGTIDLDSNVSLGYYRPIRLMGSDTSYYIKSSGNTLGELTFYGSGKWRLDDDLVAREIHVLNGVLNLKHRFVRAIQEFTDDKADIAPVNFNGLSSVLRADSSIIKTAYFNAGIRQTASTQGSKIWVSNQIVNTNLIQWDTLLVDGTQTVFLDNVNQFNVAHFASDANITGSLDVDSVYFEKGNTYWSTNIDFSTIVADGDCGNYIDFKGNQNNLWDAGSGNHTLSYCIFEDVTVTNGSISSSGSFDNSGNSGILFTPSSSRVLYWVGGNGLWSDSTHWSLSSGGVSGACLPSPIDSIVFDYNSTNGSNSLNVSLVSPAYGKDIVITPFGPSLSIMYSNEYLNVYGSLYFNEEANINCNVSLLSDHGNELLQTDYSYFRSINLDADSSYYIVSDSLRVLSFRQYQGNIDLNGNYGWIEYYEGNADTLTNLNGEMYFGYASVSNSWNISDSKIIVSNAIYFYGNIHANNSFIDMTGTNARLIFNSNDTLASVVFSNVNGNSKYSSSTTGFITHMEFMGNGEFQTDTYCDTLVFSNGQSYFIEANKEVHIDSFFDCDGDFCNPILIRSTNQGVQANISLGDTLSGNFLEIRDINSSGIAPFYAGNKSADQGNNSNILWANKPGYVWGFGPDRFLISCYGSPNDSISLPTDGFEDALGFTWFDGSNGSTFSTNNQGLYWVEANYGGCSVPDTIGIFFDTISLELESTFFCVGDTINLQPVRDTFNNQITLLWNDGSNHFKKSFLITKDTSLWVQAQDSYGNVCSDTIRANFVSSDLFPDSISLLNCSLFPLDTSFIESLIDVVPDSINYVFWSNYDLVNNIYDGYIGLSAYFNECRVDDSIYLKLDSVGTIIPNKTAFCPGSLVIWETNHINSDFVPEWIGDSSFNSNSLQRMVYTDSSVYFARTDDLGRVCGDTVFYTLNQTVTVASTGYSQTVIAPYMDTIQGNVFGDGNMYSWYLNGQQVSMGIGVFNTVSINLVDTGIYHYFFYGMDSIYGCKDSIDFTITVAGQAPSYFPNAFTPNGDNINDTWIPVINTSKTSSVVLRIFDSYGNKVYQKNDNDISWDGTNQAGELCNSDVYTVTCSFMDLSGSWQIYKGTIALLQ